MKKILLFILLINYSYSSAQTNQKNELLLYNVGFGGISSGIGAMINNKGNKPLYEVFLKGFYQGCIGGALQYAGKSLTHQIVKHENYWYAWPSKIVHSAGASIVYNAALNNPFGKYWNIDLGAFRLDFGFATDNPFRVRFNALILFDLYQFRNDKIDWQLTLQTGALVSKTPTVIRDIRDGNWEAIGEAYTRSFTYSEAMYEGQKHKVVAHELIHVYQYREYLVFNTYWTPLSAKINPTINKVLNKYIYIELPYISPFYLIEGRDYNDYYKNFFEFEAERLSANKPL